MVLKCTKIKVLKVLFKKNFQVSIPKLPLERGQAPRQIPPLSTFVPRFGACGPTPYGRGIFCLTKFFVLGTALVSTKLQQLRSISGSINTTGQFETMSNVMVNHKMNMVAKLIVRNRHKTVYKCWSDQ